MATTQDFANFVPGPRVLAEYLLYVLRGMRTEFERATMGSTHQTIYMPDLRRLAMPVPTKPEQIAIVALLRRRLPRLDVLIANKARPRRAAGGETPGDDHVSRDQGARSQRCDEGLGC